MADDLEHLTSGELATFVGTLRPGSDLDARGTTLSQPLLATLVDAVRDRDGNAVFGEVTCQRAHIRDDARFDGVRFKR